MKQLQRPELITIEIHITGLVWTSILLPELIDFLTKTMILLQFASYGGEKEKKILKCQPVLVHLLLLCYAKLSELLLNGMFVFKFLIFLTILTDVHTFENFFIIYIHNYLIFSSQLPEFQSDYFSKYCKCHSK